MSASFDLIDTHQHLFLREHLRYAWTEGEPRLAGSFTPEDYARIVEGGGVVGTIFMESGVDDADYRKEARVVSALIGQGEVPLLGQIASCRPEIDAGFGDWLEECRDLGVVGFRRILHVMPDETSRTEGYRANVRRIGTMGWPVDICMAARQLDIAAELVRACPETVFVLDHCGTNDMEPDGLAAWSARIAALAELPNLWVKFSGITAYLPAPDGMDAAARPVVETVLEEFGPSRMIWGGDWPVVDLGVGLPDWIAISRAFLAPLSADEQEQIGTRNARTVYGLDRRRET
ncbi:putative TIM-barrel fold metal-dependent hydrolase [Palleronia aestuarii]|uniref:Putative TIM-barrel fold metal-dependent hydrolase n=1 Tax=Palleronia aestuarii TaxID=568105 RepID=A0A2W7NBT3_9RHOB|nr:amidohydrolase [Palleronia aestuarii]PZX17083.1 putative TIM-barrel fold metal-dependent hydrolase [Palleronia aestuarii]